MTRLGTITMLYLESHSYRQNTQKRVAQQIGSDTIRLGSITMLYLGLGSTTMLYLGRHSQTKHKKKGSTETNWEQYQISEHNNVISRTSQLDKTQKKGSTETN